MSWAASSRPHLALPGTLSNPLGYSIISWPPDEDDLNNALETISSLGYRGTQLMGWVQEAYAGGKTLELKDRLQMLKVFPAALSCSEISLRPDSPEAFTAKFRDYADFFHTLGGKILQLIDGGQPRTKYSADEFKSLGAKMNELGKVAKDSGMIVGYHPHFKTLGETREGLRRVLDATNPQYVGLIADVAHLTLGGSDPAEVIRTYHQRLTLVHLKDVRRDAYELARRNPEAAGKLKARFCEIGRGVVDFTSVTAAMRDIRFQGWVIVELDGYQSPPGGPAEGAQTNTSALRRLGFNP